MKYSRYVDISTDNSSTYSDEIEISPRYGFVEFTFQRIVGSDQYDLVVQGADKVISLDEADWADLMSATAVSDGDKKLSLGSRPHSHNFYRAKLSCAGDITVKFWVTGMRL